MTQSGIYMTKYVQIEHFDVKTLVFIPSLFVYNNTAWIIWKNANNAITKNKKWFISVDKAVNGH